MKFDKHSLRLYVVTDRRWLRGQTLEEQVEEIIKAGTSFIQLREKELEHKQFVEMAKKLKEVTDSYGIPFVINDNVEVALEVNADGIHVGQSDTDVEQVRALLGPNKIVGASARTLEQALLAQEKGADYLGVGAVFATSTKEDAKTLSRNSLKKIANGVDIPVVAIGGITENNILGLKGSNIAGVALISSILAAPNVGEATKKMANLVKEVV
ncbi:MAG: thiamine phosphate synthase [Bacillota bacterium]|nr:thiamine phosphate synthase [Bacillota bacterium]HHU62127.1 thiamine phosphate synthase [Natronincola sp.]